MSSSSDLEVSVLSQAAEWFALLNGSEVDAVQKLRWQKWLQSDVSHQQAWEKVQKIDQRFDMLPQQESQSVLKAAEKKQYIKLKNLFSLVLILPCLWLVTHLALGSKWLADYQTKIGGMQAITLVESSKLWLNTNSALNVEYSNTLRRLKLIEGEVLVESASDYVTPRRPLLVENKHGRVTAIGTRFAVRKLDTKTLVQVFEGSVEIAPHDSVNRVQISSGVQAEFDKKGVLSITENYPYRDAWSRGMLQVDGMPICEVVAELSRYHEGKISCSLEVAHLKLVGAYPLQELDRTFKAMQASLPIKISQSGANDWSLSMR
jgi:transmembrane sensor